MKKVVLAVVVLAGFAALTSCKKDHVCTCSGEIIGIPFSGADTTYTDMTKKDADAACQAYDETVDADNFIDCELK